MKLKMDNFPANNPNPVLSVAKDGIVIYSNSAGVLLLNEWALKVGEKMSPYFTDVVNNVISTNAPQRIEVKVDNRVYLVSFHHIPEEERVNIYGFDISDQKKLERKLRESERKYHLLYENMLDGFAYCRMLYDDSGNPVDFIYLDTNSAFERLTGLKEVKGKKITEVIPGIKEQHPELFDAYGRVALTGQPERFEIEFKPLGIWLWVSVYRTEREHFVAVFENITDSKRAVGELIEAYEKIQVQSEELHVSNEELRVQSEELIESNKLLQERETGFRTLAENSPDLIARFDKQNRCTYANPAITKIYGIPLIAEFYGLSINEFVDKLNSKLQIDPEVAKLSEKQREKVLTTGKPKATEFHYTSVQGKEYYFDTQIVPEFTDGEVSSVLVVSRDITTLKESEAKLKETLDNLEKLVKERTSELEEAYINLKESENRLSEAQRISRIGNWDWNIITNKLYLSDEVYRIYGCKPQEFGVTRNKFLSYVHPYDRDFVENSFKRALNEKTTNIDYRIILADGEERVVHAQSEVIFNEENIPVRMRGTIQDITERKKAEEKIKDLANVVESSGDAIMTNSLDGIISSWNKGAEHIYGYSAEEILGKNVSILEPDNLKGEIKQFFEKIKRDKKTQHYDTLRLKKNGTIINVSVTLSPVFDESGGLAAISAIVRDITENIKAKEALRLSNIYNRSLIEASLDPLVTIGHDGKITDLNTSTELATGYSRDEMIGTDFANYFTEPEKAEKVYQEVFKDGFVSDYALEIRHRNGSIKPVLYNASVYNDESGKVIGIFAAARDITERRRAEEKLKLKLEELARSNAELEQFAYVSSHDLQEPLRMISSYLQLLQRRYQGKLDEKADKYIYFAVDGASRMQNLINDLLEFSRVTTKAGEPELIDSEFILNQVLSSLELYIKENKATVSHDSLPKVIADNTQLAQVFQNLIANGIKFHSEETPKIHISAERKAGEWVFSVQDNGIGIDPNYSEKIFEVFKRLHKKEEYPGTGIGLAICKKIIERHGGRIWVESEFGKGSTFYFTLHLKTENSSIKPLNI